MLLKKEAKRPYSIVIGCGSAGAEFAFLLCKEGEEVLVIDREKDSFSKLPSFFDGRTLAGDATYPDILEAAEIGRATSLFLLTGCDNCNIFIARAAKELYGVGRVLARLNDPERQGVYEAFGVETFYPAPLVADSLLKLQKSVKKEDLA